MAVDVFLMCKDIKGEATDKEFPDAIEINGLHWGIKGGGHGTRIDSEVRNVTIRKNLDRASPIIWMFCCTHSQIKEMKLHFRKAGKDPLTYLTIKLEKVYVVSTDLQIGEKGEVPQETVVLDFILIDSEYQPQSLTGAKSGGAVMFSWDAGENKG